MHPSFIYLTDLSYALGELQINISTPVNLSSANTAYNSSGLIWFAQATLTDKTITSSLNNAVSADIVFNVDSCDGVGVISVLSNAGSRNYNPDDYVCSNNQVTLSSATIGTGNTVISIDNGCSTYSNIGYLLIRIASSILVLLSVVVIVYRKGGLAELTTGEIVMLGVMIIVGVALATANSNIIAASCGPGG